MTAALILAVGANDAGLVEACGPKSTRSWLCSTVYRISGDSTAAEVADAVAKPVRILVVLLVAWILVRVSRVAVSRFVRHVGGGVARLATLRAGVAVVDLAGVTPERSARRAQTIGALLRSVVALLIWSVAVLTILDELGINLAPLLAGAGIAGLALGFGAQALVRDFLTGLFMLVEDQYGVGDVIDAGVATGTVEALNLRTTRLRDPEGVVWHVPNGEIRRVGNLSQHWARTHVDVGIPAAADLDAALAAIGGACRELRRDDAVGTLVLDDPEVLGLESLAADRVVVRVAVRTRPEQQLRVARALRGRLRQALAHAGISEVSA